MMISRRASLATPPDQHHQDEGQEVWRSLGIFLLFVMLPVRSRDGHEGCFPHQRQPVAGSRRGATSMSGVGMQAGRHRAANSRPPPSWKVNA
jgi:hypothetical protein